jgi:transposase
MGRRTDKQAPMWVGTTELPRSPGHRFYEKLDELLRAAGFDKQVEALCESSFDAGAAGGRLSIVPGVYFRMLLVGYKLCTPMQPDFRQRAEYPSRHPRSRQRPG